MTNKNMNKGKAGDADKYAGKILRQMRKLKGLSQSDLAGHLDLTFQQIQKYEKGTNRISVGRIKQLSEIMSVSPLVFFEDFNNENSSLPKLDKEQIKLLKIFEKVPDSKKMDFLKLSKNLGDIITKFP